MYEFLTLVTYIYIYIFNMSCVAFSGCIFVFCVTYLLVDIVSYSKDVVFY